MKAALGFPGHVGVGIARAALQELDYTPTGHIQVFAGIAAVRPAVADEGADKGGINPLGGDERGPEQLVFHISADLPVNKCTRAKQNTHFYCILLDC